MVIIYGQNDWMDYQDALGFLKDNKVEINYQFILNGDHQLQYTHY